MSQLNPRVKDVSALDNYKLHIEFTNGEQGIYDCSSLLDFGIFKELKDKNYFNQVRVSLNTIAWPNGQDICPDTVYLDSAKENIKLTA